MVGEKECLVNPEDEFQRINIKIHGITPDKVADKLTFDEAYSQFLEEKICECIFVSHNAKSADMHHIRHSLEAYGIEAPKFNFIDTMDLASQLFPEGKRGLSCICDYYGIDGGRHHSALDDARACMKVFLLMTEQLGVPDPQQRPAGYKERARSSRHSSNAINGSDRTFSDVLEELNEIGLRGDTAELKSASGLSILVTGFVEGYTRDEIKRYMERVGARPASRIGNRTDFLSIGPNAGQEKINSAKQYDVPVISNEELLDLLARS